MNTKTEIALAALREIATMDIPDHGDDGKSVRSALHDCIATAQGALRASGLTPAKNAQEAQT